MVLLQNYSVGLVFHTSELMRLQKLVVLYFIWNPIKYFPRYKIVSSLICRSLLYLTYMLFSSPLLIISQGKYWWRKWRNKAIIMSKSYFTSVCPQNLGGHAKEIFYWFSIGYVDKGIFRSIYFALQPLIPPQWCKMTQWQKVYVGVKCSSRLEHTRSL